MDSLEMYKRLSSEDKHNLIAYCIYDSIYTVATNENYSISDEEVKRIKDLSYYAYLKDEYYNLSPTRISDFITENHIKKNTSLDELEKMSWSVLLEKVDNNYNLYSKDGMER